MKLVPIKSEESIQRAQLFICSSAVDKRVLDIKIEETFSQIFPETLETEGGDYIKLTVIDEHLKADLDEKA